MRRLISLFALMGVALGGEVSLRQAIDDALKNNLEIRAMEREVSSARLELRASRGAYLPRLKLEETFTRTDVPAYAFMSRLNQERITMQDFDPLRLNNPSAINNLETKISLEIPIWMGGRIQAYERASLYSLKAVEFQKVRKEEEVILKTYQAYADAYTAKSAISVAQQSVKDAQEHVRLAQTAYNTGVALLSDVLRAKVYLSKAQEMLTQAKNNYETAKKALELFTNTPYGEFEVEELGACPVVDFEQVKAKALENREDIKALAQRISAMREMSRAVLSDNLPQVFAFGSYYLNSKSTPLGSDGRGYMLGIGVSWSLDTGLATYNRYLAHQEKVRAMEERLKLLQNSVEFELKRAYSDYLNSLESMKSAQSRVEQSKEVLRVMQERYKVGLARMVDVLDAQTELDRARFEYVQSLGACHKAYVNLLYSAGLTREVLR